MSSLFIILALLFSLIIAIIAAANHQPVNVNYIFGQAELSLIVLIIGAAATGALVMGMISLYRGIRNAMVMRGGKKHQEELQQRLDKLEQEKISLKEELKRLQEPAGAVEERGGEAS
ncbi:MAG: LapA family protein [Firmicutes bacterium]|nr:LapA family protein [Bacillota bacterium]